VEETTWNKWHRQSPEKSHHLRGVGILCRQALQATQVIFSQ